MDLGLSGKTALVCAASKGLGKACAVSLSREGVDVTIVARTAKTLEVTAEEIRQETGGDVTAIAADIVSKDGQAAALLACPAPDILVNNAGGPPPGNFRDWDREDWIKALDANMLTSIFLTKATIDGMIERKFGRIVNITSGSVKSPIPTLGLSNGARTGLTGFIAGLSRECARHNVTINNLLPGPFETDRLRANMAAAAKKAGVSTEAMMDQRRNSNPARRFGVAAEFGDACAYLCSAQAGFVTGQNFLMDGGAFNSTI
ncbi:MAG: SDR family oxidoreductase [Rhodospirillales bacterium]